MYLYWFSCSNCSLILGAVSLKNANSKSEKTQSTIAIIAGILSIFIFVGMVVLGSDSNDKGTNDTETEIVQVVDSETEIGETEISTEVEVQETENSDEVLQIALDNLDASINAVSGITIPTYSGTPYVEVNSNVPYFTDEELTTTAFEMYSELDTLGRCGAAYVNVCKEIMPIEERGNIGAVRPTGWHTVKYDCINDLYLYNRCHLVGYQLAGENSNIKNLITGTRYLNVEGMLPFENMVDDYVEETDNHVLYRVTPVFEGNNLVASGVIIEAKSVEDNGEGVLFNVYCYNVQPGISIDYLTGESSEIVETPPQQTGESNGNNESESTNQSSTGGEETPSEGDETLVWLSATGEMYHSRNDCGRMNPDNATQVTEAYAIENKYGKCSKCW